MIDRAPWGARPIKEKAYGPREIIFPGPGWISVGVGSYFVVELPAWAKLVQVVTANTNNLLRWRPGSDRIPADTDGPAYYYLTSSVANASQYGGWQPAMCRDITIFHAGAIPDKFYAWAMLSDVPRAGMPPEGADRGQWATYNGPANDPT